MVILTLQVQQPQPPSSAALDCCPAILEDLLFEELHSFEAMTSFDKLLTATSCEFSDAESDSMFPMPTECSILQLTPSETGLHNDSNDPMFGVEKLHQNWLSSHPVFWSSHDVLEWVYNEASMAKLIDPCDVSGEKMQNISGDQLVKMTPQDFRQLLGEFGEFLHDNLHQLLSQWSSNTRVISADNTKALPSIGCFISHYSSSNAVPSTATENQLLTMRTWNSSAVGSIAAEDVFNQCGDLMFGDGFSNPLIAPYPQAIRSSLTWPEIDLAAEYLSLPSTPSSPMSSSSDCDNSINNSEGNFDRIFSSATNEWPTQVDQMNRKRQKTVEKPARQPRKNSESELSDASTGSACNSSAAVAAAAPAIVRRRREKSRTPHLWKFMRTLLEDPQYNPEYIRWENKSDGVFRIVPGQSKHIALLWGQKKNNPKMTFDKLSRSLRWCRKNGFLADIPKNCRYPKKLCFRFASFALDWSPVSSLTIPSGTKPSA